MADRRYQAVQSRTQSDLFPPTLEDLVSKENPVRAIDAFVETLDLHEMGFCNAGPGAGAGQPAFDPAILLKLYLYGYQFRIHSSRRLEAETQRNVHVMWLCKGATPSYKTIANFRKDNLEALRAASREFIALCRELSLFGGKQVAVDGTFLKGSVNPGNIHTRAGLEKDLKYLDEKIAGYLRQLDESDAGPQEDLVGGEDVELEAKIKVLRERQQKKQELREDLEESGENQVSEVDADARLLKKNGKTVGGYNGQIVVDDKLKLIVAAEVVQDGNDMGQLAPMMEKAAEALDNRELTGLADAGYCTGEQIKACEDQGMQVYVPVPKHASRKGRDGRFGSEDFGYDENTDTCKCPAGQELTRVGSTVINGMQYARYGATTEVCRNCPLKDRCLSKSQSARMVHRSEHADVMDRHRRKMNSGGDRVRRRSALVEHPFGTLKRWAGIDHFLMRGLDKCQAEFSLMTLGYNFKRVINTIGVETFREYCVQRS